MEATDQQRPTIELLQSHELGDGNSLPLPLHLMLTRSQDLQSCPFWISTYREGTCSPQKIFDMPSIEGIFKLLMDQGLTENQALMLAENNPGFAARQFYLIPEKICQTEPDRTRELIVSTLEALGPEKVGLYFPSSANDLLVRTHLIEELSLGISFLRTKELYFYTGSMGLNPLMNAALRIKLRLEGRREVLVFH